MLTLAELKAEWSIDCNINKDDIGLESIKTASLHAKYINEWASYKSRQVKLASDFAAMRKLRTRYYRGELTQAELIENNWEQYQGVKLPKTETETFLAGDAHLIDLNNKLEYCRLTIGYLDQVLKLIYNRSFLIRDYIEDRKFQMGY
jgi:hypothetical protein